LRLFGDFFGGEKVTPPAGGNSCKPKREGFAKEKWGSQTVLNQKRFSLRKSETGSFLSQEKGKNRFQKTRLRPQAEA